jgi:hypothetical protein
MSFNPHDRDMNRDRGQVLFRYRPGQTFDHVGGHIGQVRQYASDDAYDGPVLDHDDLIRQAMQLVRWWRREGRAASGAISGSDRAPEFPSDDPLAANHYQILIPGKVFCGVWPRVIRCARPACGRVYEAPDPKPQTDWPPACPTCRHSSGNRQLQFVFGHPCGEIQSLRPPRNCGRGHSTFRLNDKVSRFKDFRWECLTCGISLHVQLPCPNTSCSWTDNRLMAPLLHTAGSAYSGKGMTLVNVLTKDEAQRLTAPGYTVAAIGRWLGECSVEDADRLTSAEANTAVPQEVLDSISAMEQAGLAEQADLLRRRFVPVDLENLATAVSKILGYDPRTDERGAALAAALSTYERVLRRDRLDITRIQRQAVTPGRVELYGRYPAVLREAGFDPDHTCLLGDFPITYLGVGYTRGGFEPREADLVPYRGRVSKGAPQTTLLYAHPSTTEALLFVLDPERVRRWMIANGLLNAADVSDAADLKRWFAARLDPMAGQLPTFSEDLRPGDADWPARELFGLLHSLAHQLIRALAVDSGYTETSLSEYLFPYELAFALHPSGGNGSGIGALRTVLEQNLDAIVKRAVDNDSCLYDPNCMQANRGADHGCLLLPETACRCWNRHLSRWYLYGAPDGSVTGYWDPDL